MAHQILIFATFIDPLKVIRCLRLVELLGFILSEPEIVHIS